jgi:hypothetical protein
MYTRQFTYIPGTARSCVCSSASHTPPPGGQLLFGIGAVGANAAELLRPAAPLFFVAALNPEQDDAPVRPRSPRSAWDRRGGRVPARERAIGPRGASRGSPRREPAGGRRAAHWAAQSCAVGEG